MLLRTLARCAGHMLVERCHAGWPMSRISAKTLAAALRVFTTHRTCECLAINSATCSQSRGSSCSLGHSTRTRRSWLKRSAGDEAISVAEGIPAGSHSVRCHAGCVAVQRTTVHPRYSAICWSILHVGAVRPGGRVWHSSRMMALLAMLCSLRQRPGWLEKSDSKNWTLVVATTGASQFSARRSARSEPVASVSPDPTGSVRL